MRVECVWCGPRDESEFRCAGPVTEPLPSDLDSLTGVAWARVLYQRANPEGWVDERWLHAAGCGQWLIVTRHTVSHEMAGSRPARPRIASL
jgi:sarcosine oxidase, subunit delta